MAKTKAAGTTRLGRDSVSKRLGIKLSGGQKARAGVVLIRQRGSRYLAGRNVRVGADDTLYAARNGVVHYKTVRKTKFNGKQRKAKIVEVL